MFNLRTSLVCVPLILAAFTLALPNAPEHTSAPNVDYPEYHPIETNLGTVLCLHYNSYGQLIGEKLPLHNKPPTDWYFNASVSDIKPFRNVLANTEEVCNLGPQGCRTLGCKAGKGAIGWCNESGHKIRMPCRFLTEYVDEIVELQWVSKILFCPLPGHSKTARLPTIGPGTVLDCSVLAMAGPVSKLANSLTRSIDDHCDCSDFPCWDTMRTHCLRGRSVGLVSTVPAIKYDILGAEFHHNL
ncbi:hypothetical protein V8F06_001939 [Rhypophila decipiens]